MTNLSTHFTLEELTASTKAKMLGIENKPNAHQVANLKSLCVNCLEKVRTLLGKPMIITSGYRCLALNRAVGSKPTSHHVIGLACDFVVRGMTTKEIFENIKDSSIQYTQLIQERSGKSEWVHISYVQGNLKRENLIYNNGVYKKV